MLRLEGELDVYEGRDGLDGAVVLALVQEVARARLELWVPVDYVELRFGDTLLFGFGVSTSTKAAWSVP